MERLSRWKVELFCTDNWGVYPEVIAAGKLCQSKSQTVYLEQNLIRYTLFVKTSKVKRIGEHDN